MHYAVLALAMALYPFGIFELVKIWFLCLGDHQNSTAGIVFKLPIHS